MLTVRTIEEGSGRLLIDLKREVILYPRTPRHDALRYLIEEPNYVLDPRNPKHRLLSWTTCVYDRCALHYHAKQELRMLLRKQDTY